MAAQFVQAPYDNTYAPAGQPLVYTITRSTAITPGFKFVIIVSEDGVQVAKYYMTPNQNDGAQFDLNQVIKGRVNVSSTSGLEPLLPIHASTEFVTPGLEAATRIYQIDIAEYTGTEGSVDATKYIVATDGYFQIADGFAPDYSDYLGTVAGTGYKKTWLSDRIPTGATNDLQMFAAEEDQGVSAFIYDETKFTFGAGGISYIDIQIVKSDGSTQDFTNKNIETFSGVNPAATDYTKKIIYAACMPATVSAAQAFNFDWASYPTWSYYYLWLKSGAGNTIARWRIDRDTRPCHKPIQLAWTNTVGGWDYLRFDNRSNKSIQVQRKEYTKTIGDYSSATAFTFDKHARQTAAFQVDATNEFTLANLGFSLSETQLLQYAIRSKNVMFRVGTGDWLPGNIKTGSINIAQDHSTKLFSVSLKLTQAQNIRC